MGFMDRKECNKCEDYHATSPYHSFGKAAVKGVEFDNINESSTLADVSFFVERAEAEAA